jgi:5-methylcytosine-specific restriction endonuclease McrA
MSWHKIRIRPADRLMSQYIKARDKGICQYRFKCFGDQGTDNSHFQKRRKESVRFDPENCDLACRKCHYFVENHPDGQKTLEEFKRQQLGEKRYKMLLIRANQTGRKDDALAIIYIKQLIREL